MIGGEALKIKKELVKRQVKSYQDISDIGVVLENILTKLGDDGKRLIIEELKKINVGIGSSKIDFDPVVKSIENIKIENNIDVGSLESVLISIDELLKNKELKIRFPKDAKDAIPVVLSDKTKKEFYNALASISAGGSVDTSRLATSAKQLPDNHNVNVSNLPDTTLLATSAKQLPDNHQVTVSNPTADPETGLAKDATLTDGSQVTKTLDSLPTAGNNPSTVLAYDIDGNLSTITETIGTDQYQTTLSYTGGVLSSISSSVKL